MVAICDRNCYVIATFVAAIVNCNESPLLPRALNMLKNTSKHIGVDLNGSTMSLDGVYDSQNNRKKIFNMGMKPNIHEIPEIPEIASKPNVVEKGIIVKRYSQSGFIPLNVFFTWEDKFKRLLLRFVSILG